MSGLGEISGPGPNAGPAPLSSAAAIGRPVDRPDPVALTVGPALSNRPGRGVTAVSSRAAVATSCSVERLRVAGDVFCDCGHLRVIRTGVPLMVCAVVRQKQSPLQD
jgi:hypothetical protein